MSRIDDTHPLPDSVSSPGSGYGQLRDAYDELAKKYEALQEKINQPLTDVSVKEYSDLFYLNPLPMWIYDFDTTKFIDVNQAAIRHYGYTREEFLQMDISGIRTEAEAERLRKTGGKLTAEMDIYRGVWQHIKKNGETIDVEVTAQLLNYGGRKATLVLLNDITEKKRVESRLIRSNRQLLAAQEIAHLGYWELNLATLEIQLSEESKRILELPDTCTSIGYKDFFSLIHPDDRQYFISKQQAVLAGETPVTVEHRVLLKSGSVKTLMQIGSLVFDDKGVLVLFEGTVQDITDRKKAEKAIAESERRMKNAQYVGSVGDWEYDCQSGMFTWSDELFRLFAIDPALGPPTLEDFISFYTPADAEKLRVYIHRCMTMGENYEADLSLSLPGDADAYHYVVGTPSMDNQGRVIKLYGIVQDITARKQAEIKLNAEHNQLRILINTLPDSIYIKDVLGRKVITNKVDLSLMGISEHEALDKTDEEIFGDRNGKKRFADDMQVIKHGKAIHNQEEYFVDRNGVETWLLTSKVPIKNEQGEITGLLGVGRIITERKKAEEALRASNERFLYATRATSDAIWDWDIVEDVIYWGDGYEKIFGYTLLEHWLSASSSFENIHPDDRQMVLDGIYELLNGTDSNWSHEYRYKRADNLYVPVHDKGVVVRNEEGKAIRMIGAMQDVTERKQAEEAIRKTQEKFATLVNTVDGIVWEAEADTFAFTYVSGHAEKLLGYPTQRWITEKNFWVDHIHPDDREWAVNYCVACTTERKEHQFEYRMIAADGRTVWLADFVAIVVDENQHAQLRGIMVDITERKKAEEALSNERKLLRVLIDNLPDYIYVKDASLNHVINNRANVTLLGFETEEETLNKTITELLGESIAGDFLRDDQAVLDTGLPIIDREEPIRDHTGHLRWLLTTKIPLKDENNMVTGLVGISHDITERKHIHEELQEKNRQLKKLSAHLQSIREEERKILAREVHDELGQLASVVKMDIDWLTLRLPGLEEGPLKRLQHATSTTDLLINTIRKIASTLRPSMLDELGLNASLAWQCKEFTTVSGIPCVFDPLFDDANLPMTVKTELFRICQESLTNVMRHASASKVQVSIAETKEGVRLTVADNGKGFDVKQKSGTLGLIGMRERALSVNGRLVIESTPRRGTSVSTIVPLNTH